jgi:membrane peptidoglycan carboxypeptidase
LSRRHTISSVWNQIVASATGVALIGAAALVVVSTGLKIDLGLPKPTLPSLKPGPKKTAEDSYGQPCNPVSIKKVSPYMIQAVLAAEDHRFYEHHGIDALGLVRANIDNLKAGHMVEGGSTITQQLAKNVFLDWRDRSALRKMKEWILAIELERRYSKEEILQAYLNCVYFGSGAYGIENAAKTYFGTSASKLTIAQCAFLAALLKAPSDLCMPSNQAAAFARQQNILNNMAEYGYITEEQKRTAQSRPIKVLPFSQKSEHS